MPTGHCAYGACTHAHRALCLWSTHPYPQGTVPMEHAPMPTGHCAYGARTHAHRALCLWSTHPYPQGTVPMEHSPIPTGYCAYGAHTTECHTDVVQAWVQTHRLSVTWWSVGVGACSSASESSASMCLCGNSLLTSRVVELAQAHSIPFHRFHSTVLFHSTILRHPTHRTVPPTMDIVMMISPTLHCGHVGCCGQNARVFSFVLNRCAGNREF